MQSFICAIQYFQRKVTEFVEWTKCVYIFHIYSINIDMKLPCTHFSESNKISCGFGKCNEMVYDKWQWMNGSHELQDLLAVTRQQKYTLVIRKIKFMSIESYQPAKKRADISTNELVQIETRKQNATTKLSYKYKKW